VIPNQFALLAESECAEDQSNVLAQASRLSWHATRCAGQIAFPGNGLTKFSDDLASGSAGILVALQSLFSRTRICLPFLN
jgi:hypothetical protein